jgi:hypothetical protein
MSVGVLLLLLVLATVFVLCVLGVVFRGSDADLLDLHPERLGDQERLDRAELAELRAAEGRPSAEHPGDNGRWHADDHTAEDLRHDE